jgi:hypothetical protein
VARERQLGARREDPDRALGRVLDEDRLGEAELERNRLAAVRRNRAAIEEDTERIAAPAIRADEDAEDMEPGHVSASSVGGAGFDVAGVAARSSAVRCMAIIVIASVIRPSIVIANASSNGSQRIARSSLGSGDAMP